MHWNVELVNGTTYGPINLSAIRYLMEDGSVARSATIENVDTGDTMRALHMLSPEIQELYATIQEQSQMLDSLTRELEQQREKVARLKTSSGEADTSAPIPGTPPKLVRNRILKKDE
jgi:hypothetical protein